MFSSNTTQVSDGGYQISRSLRFNSADTAYLARTPSTTTNRTTFTFSAWIKTSTNYSGQSERDMITAWDGTTSQWGFLDFKFSNGFLKIGNYNTNAITTAVFRDPSAWYHFVWATDTTQATDTDRFKVYVNGVQQTLSGTFPPQNQLLPFNTASINNSIGWSFFGTQLFDGYMTDINFIDGQQLTPSSFGETDTQTGVWKPKAYSGSYGTNGFYLNFSDNSNTTAATLGKDYSGNGNNWTPNNFSVTAGAGNDSLVDSPTSYGTDTGVGGEVRGNYSTMNPLDNYNTSAAVAFTFANGNLDVSRSNQSWASSRSTMAMSSGKWYAEMTVTASTAGTLNAMFGIAKQDFTINDYFGGQSGGYGYNAANGQKYNGGSAVSYGATFTTNDVIGVAYDADAGSLVFYKNGTSQGTAYTGLSGTFCFAIGLFPQTSGSITATLNCGQRPFAYTAPSGFKALCTQNLPTPTIGATTATQAGKYFTPTIYTGNGSASRAITNGINMVSNGGLVWSKQRSGVESNFLIDNIRGNTKYLMSNSVAAENTISTLVTSFDSTGYSIGNDSGINGNGSTYVSWVWGAGGSGSTNTAGSITSTVSANTTAGFSIVTYTGNATSGATVGHGLGVAPSMIILKIRSTTGNWPVYHVSTGNTKALYLDLTLGAGGDFTGAWNNTTPTSTVFTLGNSTETNASAGTFVAYCFAPIAGYSAFGSYVGNGSTDGTFVFTGFRPACIILKVSDGTASWLIHDNKRNVNNVVDKKLFPNLSDAEATADVADFLSNGFKLRGTNTQFNGNGYNYIYMAFAENPFKYSLAR